jgi:hypothetical protein
MRYCHKAMRLDLSGLASFLRKLLAIVLPVLLLGCSSTGHTPPRPELVISGWRDPAALAPGADFETYVRNVSQELLKHRLPFVASMADAELGKVAPFRTLPDRGCKKDEPRASPSSFMGFLTRRLSCGILRRHSQNSVSKPARCCCPGMGHARQI